MVIFSLTTHSYRFFSDLQTCLNVWGKSLDKLIGETIFCIWSVWDVKNKMWFDNAPVLIECASGILSVNVKNETYLAIGWNDILLSDKPIWSIGNQGREIEDLEYQKDFIWKKCDMVKEVFHKTIKKISPMQNHFGLFGMDFSFYDGTTLYIYDTGSTILLTYTKGTQLETSHKYIQIRHWDYWWCVYNMMERHCLSGVEFSITDDVNGEKQFFHLDLYSLIELESTIRIQEFVQPEDPFYCYFLNQIERLRQGKIDYFIGWLYYQDYKPNIKQCNRFLKKGQSIFDMKTPQISPYYAVVFIGEKAPLLPSILIHWLEKLSVPLFDQAITFEIANIPTKAQAKELWNRNI